MAFFNRFDFSNGNLPPWLAPFIGLTRPLVTSLTAAIIPVGGFCVFVLALFWPVAAVKAVVITTQFFREIPQNLYQLIGTIVLAYTGAVTLETFRKPPQPSPENNAIDAASDGPPIKPPPVDTAPKPRGPMPSPRGD